MIGDILFAVLMLGSAAILVFVSRPLSNRYGAGAILRWLCLGVAIAFVVIWISQVV